MTPTEKGFRLVLCGECSKKLKFNVVPAMYNTTVNIRCPECKSVASVFIPTPAATQEQPKRASQTSPFTSPDTGQFSDFFNTFFGSGFPKS